MGKYYDSEQKRSRAFLEESGNITPKKNVLVMEREEAVCFYLFYDVKAKKKFYTVFEAIGSTGFFYARIHDYGALRKRVSRAGRTGGD